MSLIDKVEVSGLTVRVVARTTAPPREAFAEMRVLDDLKGQIV
jgi:hypothetical protein